MSHPSLSEQIHSILAVIDDPVASAKMSPAWWDQAQGLLADHQVEVFERPSANPGVAGNKGASPKQLAFQKAFFEQKHRIYAASGANQSGKTECAAGMCFAKWIRDHARNGDAYWVIAQTHETMRDIPHKTLWKFLPRSMFPANVEYSPRLGFGMISTLHLNLPGGRGKCEIWFRTQDSDLTVFESARLNGVWWTECTREALFDALQPRLAAKGGFMVMDYVPVEGWHRMRLQSGNNPYIFHTRFAMADNGHNLNPGEIDYQRTMMSPEEAAVRIDGKDGAAFGVVFKEFKAEPYNPETGEGGHLVHTRPVPKDAPAWLYIDVGKYTAAILCTVHGDGIKYIADEAYTFGVTVEENVGEINRMLERNGRTIGDLAGVFMDPAAYHFSAANQASVGEQYEMAGLPVQTWIRTNTVGEPAMLDKMRVEFMHKRLMVYDRCEKTIFELQTWKHKTDRDGKVDPNERYEGPNHAIDAVKAWVWMEPTYEQPELFILDAPEV